MSLPGATLLSQPTTSLGLRKDTEDWLCGTKTSFLCQKDVLPVPMWSFADQNFLNHISQSVKVHVFLVV